jgi:hypothetical protein
LRFDPAAGAAAAGEALAALYAGFAAENQPALAELVSSACGALGVAADDTARLAAVGAAPLAARDIRNAYHNANHTREVVASAVWLSVANQALAAHGAAGARRLTSGAMARLILLAVCHDIGHDGTANAAPFRQEDNSFALAAPILAAQGIREQEQAWLRAMIRTTDPEFRPAVRAMTRHAVWGEAAPNSVPEAFLPIADDKEALYLAAMLADADILSSAALTHAYHVLQNAKLEAEIGRRFAPEEVLYFMDVIAGGDLASPAGQYLRPNFQAIRARVAGAAGLAR